MFRGKPSSNVGIQSESAKLFRVLPDEELGRKTSPRVPRSRHSRFSLRPCFIILFVTLAAVSGVLYLPFYYEKIPVGEHHVNFQCPSGPKEVAANFDPERFKNAYLSDQNAKDLEKFMKEFRDTSYDDWQVSYNHMKSQMAHWKRNYFAPNIQSGDHIYESAIGIGMNSLMTMEIIHEEKGDQALTVHGNDYLEESTGKANVLLERLIPEGVTKGTICAGDSSNLAHVPSNSMDFVFTGRIMPILDPLSFNQTDQNPFVRNHGRYGELCLGQGWKDQKLAEIAQQRNEDFHGKWVAEMARIARPGRPVVVEHVSQPKCVQPGDWGGVPKSFWKEGIEKYKWPIDPDSIEMVDDTVYAMQRYHVFMRKTM